MEQEKMSIEEVVRRGKELYEQGIRAKVETEENIGKVLVIDVETGDYEMDEKNHVAADRLHAKRDNAQLYGLRIGYRSMESFNGMRIRTAR